MKQLQQSNQHFYLATMKTAPYDLTGLLSECGNNRGISLLSIAGKILAKIILSRIKIIAEKVLPESQCGLRPGPSTTDVIFTLRQLQEKAIEQQQALYVVFVDFAKAFDTVERETLESSGIAWLSREDREDHQVFS